MKFKIITSKKLRRYSYLLLLLIILFSSCKKDENITPETIIDVNGFWIANETVTGNCSGNTETETKTSVYAIEQQESKLKIIFYPNGDKIDGTIEGNKITWNGTIPTVSGKTDIDFTGTATSNGNQADGTANWEWYSDTYNCSGTTKISGNKVIKEHANFAGEWTGKWESEENPADGTFSANVTQNDTILSGNIDVPFLDISNASLKGFVSGNVVYFGDIDEKIKFVGILNGNTGEGTYSYMSLSDEGSWTGTKQ